MLVSSRILFTIAFMASIALGNNAQIQVAVEPSQIQIGDVFTYTLTIESSKEDRVDLPGLVGNLTSFEVKDVQKSIEPSAKGSLHRWTLRLSTFVSGDFVIPPQEVEMVQGQDTLHLMTDPVTIRVLSRVKDAEDDILDVDVPVQDPYTPWWVWVLASLPFVALLIYVGILLWRRMQRKSVVVQMPPYEECQLAWEELRKRKLLEAGEQGEYFFQLGKIFRRYLQRRFEVDIMDATTQELPERVLFIDGLDKSLAQNICAFFAETEMVKFAKIQLSEEQLVPLEEIVSQVLTATRPVEEPKK